MTEHDDETKAALQKGIKLIDTILLVDAIILPPIFFAIFFFIGGLSPVLCLFIAIAVGVSMMVARSVMRKQWRAKGLLPSPKHSKQSSNSKM